MLYLVFTVDGDWKEYYYSRLPEVKRKPDPKRILSSLASEIQLAANILEGKLVHFVHTSPLARDFFLQPEFISEYIKIEEGGGNIGLHCHEEELYQAYFYDDEKKMESAIGNMVKKLGDNDLRPLAFRGGYLAFSPKSIPILEKNSIFLDFSCEPGRYLFHREHLVSDWRGSPANFYCLSYRDHRQPGKSRVFEIPVGIYLEKDSCWKIWQKAKNLSRQKDKIIVSVLSHAYDFGSFRKRWKIKFILYLLKRFGKFINAAEALELVQN